MPNLLQRVFSKFSPGRNEKIGITIESTESWEIHISSKSRRENCSECQCETIFVPLDLGMQIIGLSTAVKENLVLSGNLHSLDHREATKLVCLKSLTIESQRSVYEEQENIQKI